MKLTNLEVNFIKRLNALIAKSFHQQSMQYIHLPLISRKLYKLNQKVSQMANLQTIATIFKKLNT